VSIETHMRPSIIYLRISICIIFFIGLVPLLLALTEQGGSAIFALLVLVYGSLVAVPWIKAPEKVDLFEPVVYTMLMSVPIIVRPCYLLLFHGYFSIPYLPGLSGSQLWDLVTRAMALLILGHSAYLIGYYSMPHRPLSTRSINPQRWLNPKKLWKGIFVITGISLVSFATYVHINDGLTNLLVFSKRRELASGLHYLRYTTQWLQLVPLLLLAIDVQHEHRLSIWTWISLSLSSIIILAFGGRGPVILGWLLFTVAYHFLRHRVRVRHLVILMLIIAVFSAAFLEVRTSTFGGLSPDFTSAENSVALPYAIEQFLLSRLAFDVFATLIAIMPQEFDFQLGKTYLNIFAAPIPRSLWPDKPIIDEGGIVGKAIFGDEYYGIPPGNAGLFYLNFHIPGIVVGFFILGLLHRTLYQYLLNSSNRVKSTLLYSVMLLNLSSLSIMATFNAASLVIPLLLILRYAMETGQRHEY
jgi:oligosaccharide repeat unit polymerase